MPYQTLSESNKAGGHENRTGEKWIPSLIDAMLLATPSGGQFFPFFIKHAVSLAGMKGILLIIPNTGK